MVERWYSSDWHLGHFRIIAYQNRPFTNEHEMDECLIDYHNQLVKPQDHFTTLGDCSIARGGRVQQEAFLRLIKRFNGHKRMAIGNHDHFPIKVYAEAFEKVYATWRDEQGLLFSHVPVHPTSIGSAKANIHGHTHSQPNLSPAVFTDRDGKIWCKPFINISVERTGYKPLHYDELSKLVDETKIEYFKMRTTSKKESL